GLDVGVTPISRAQLLAASEVFVTNAVHGARPVRSLAGSPAAWPAGPVASQMAAALTRPRLSRPDPATARQPAGIPSAAHPRRRPGRAGPVTVLIDNYDSFTHNLAHMLVACGCSVEVVRNDEVTAEQVASLGPAGLVISPGPCTPADAGVSVDAVRACGGQVPVLGICPGHQAPAGRGATQRPPPAPPGPRPPPPNPHQSPRLPARPPTPLPAPPLPLAEPPPAAPPPLPCHPRHDRRPNPDGTAARHPAD